MPDLERELDELYAAPANEFTGRRNELAKRLKAAGRDEDAGRVGALTRPTASAAIVNRLARERPKQLAALLRANEQLRKAHRRGGEALRRAVDAEREAVESLVAASREVEPQASEASVERAARTLRSLGGDPEAAAAAERGRLSADVEPSGFGALAGLEIAAPARRADAKRRPDRGKLAEARKQVREARERALDAERAETAARRDAEAARRTLERAEERLRKLESEG